MFGFGKMLGLGRCLRRDMSKFTKKADPGIRKRKTVMPLDSFEADPEDLEPESDFMNVHESYKQHRQALAADRERMKYHIVGQKYFKENFPNFLTWHDKEQIRYLHKTNPEQWTVEQLSEGFPALPPVIAKIIKSTWTMDKQHKIQNHDRSVQKNWELFNSGRMPDLPEYFKEHLGKFTNRSLNFKPFEAKSDENSMEKPPVQGHFAEIITSYNKLKNKETAQNVEVSMARKTVERPPKGDSYLLSKVNRKTEPVTLAELKDQLEQNNTDDVNDKVLVSTLNKKKPPKEIDPDLKEDVIDLTETKPKVKKENKVALQKFEPNPRDYVGFPERISIPQRLRSRNSKVEAKRVYKLNDCYYDYDGSFLYRVPGMD